MAMGQKRLFYGWYIAGIAFLAFFLSTGTHFYAFNAFLEPLCRLRGWSRMDLNLALVIGTGFSFLCQYIYGTILMRTGVRTLMFAGTMIAGLAFICIPRAEHLWQFYLFYALLFIGNGAYGGIVASTAVNNWFLEKRGRALGLATSGMSLSGAVLPMGVLILINFIGLSDAALSIGLIIIAFGPLTWFIVKEWPEDIGVGPDGILLDAGELIACKFEDGNNAGSAFQSDWNFRDLISNGTVWKIGCSFGLLMIGTVGVMSQLKPRFTDIGFNSMTAMALMGVTAFVGAVGKYIWGTLCDRFETRTVAFVMAVANIIGLSLIFFKNSITALFLFVVIYGFSMGGTLSIYPVIIASVFGRKNFPSVLRFISIFLSLQLLGYVFAGLSFDRTGSYNAAYLIFVIFDVIAACLLFSLKTNPQS